MIWGYHILGKLHILGAIASRPIFAASSGTIKRKHPARKGTLKRSMTWHIQVDKFRWSFQVQLLKLHALNS